MAKVYLALYKGRKTIKTPKDLAFRIIEWVIRKVTGGQYSHCEITVPVAFSDGLFDCYSSSFRDGGVRCKRMQLPAEKWRWIINKSSWNVCFLCGETLRASVMICWVCYA